MLEFAYTELPGWPPLSWLARCRPGSSAVDIYHGSGVETRSGWFCEAVWDGAFADGGFDHTDVVFGSGARRRDDAIIFVSSTATVDRLHVCIDGTCTLVSNSLPCIARTAGRHAPVVPERGYIDFFMSIQNGVQSYRRDLALSNGPVQLVYFRNLAWDGHTLAEVQKPDNRRGFDCYDDYKNFLADRLVLIGDNLTSPQRAQPYSWLGTLSRGFDSPSCVALAKGAGLTRALTFNESRPGVSDDGLAVGEALGVATEVCDRLGWHGSALWEPLFISADGQGKEISIAAAPVQTQRTVLVTGHGGDYVWSARPKTPTIDLSRGSYSGLSMSEYRLHNNFIHLPVPFIAMGRAREILQISRSDEMKPWRTDGSYDRPFCARLLAEAGVPRALFGQAKTGISVRFVLGEDGWSKTGTRVFRSWRKENGQRLGLRSQQLAALRVLDFLLDVLLRIRPVIRTRALRTVARRTLKLIRSRMRKAQVEDLAFVWALETGCEAYPPPTTD